MNNTQQTAMPGGTDEPLPLPKPPEILTHFTLLFGIFLAGSVIQFATSLFKIGLPYTVVVFGLGMLAKVTIAKSNPIVIGPHLMLNIFMPILIFEGAFAMDVYVLRKVFWQALFLAGPGLVVITALTAGIAQALLESDEWNWMDSFMFGSILSATDPVAVVALLKELGASPFLSLLIEGESLMNDGTAMVAFTVLFNAIIGEAELNAYNILVKGFLRFAIGAPVFGYFTARCCLFWLSKTFNDPLCEIAATFSFAFITFFVAEHALSVSGVLALVALGVCLSNNRTSISPEVEIFLHSFWEALAYMANTLIFFLVGTIVSDLVQQKCRPLDFAHNFLIYVSINSIRAVVIIICSPLLKRIGYKLPWQFITVASWSGLRGAVGLALALMVYDEKGHKINENVKYNVFFHLCGIVFLTLVINATTIAKTLELLGMSEVSDARRAAMATALNYVTENKEKTMSIWRTDRFLADVDWGLVDRQCTLQQPWDLTQDEDEEKVTRIWAKCPHCTELVPYQPTKKEMSEMTSEAILRLLKAEKLSYWRQFEHGILSTYAVRMLKELCDNAADDKGKYMDVNYIKNTWKPTARKRLIIPQEMIWRETKDTNSVVNWIKTRMDIPSIAFEQRNYIKPSPRLVTSETASARPPPRTVREMLTNRVFVVVMAGLLYWALDGTLNVALLVMVFSERSAQSLHDFLRYLGTAFWFLMVLYCLVRIVVLKRAYIRSPWFPLSVLIFLNGLAETIVLYAVFRTSDGIRVVEYADIILVGFRFIHQLHGLEACVPLIILFLEHQEVRRLSQGYDVGRGYVMGEEEIRGRIDHMADRRDIIEQLRVHCDAAKMDILKGLGLLQKDNPEVAMGVKTRQAIRSVLNNLRDEVHTLLQDGLLEEAEGNEIAGMIESKMKKLLTAPPKVPLPSTEKILRNIPWIQDNEELVQFIKDHARLMNYEYDTIIMHQDEPTTGISIILSGLVKLEYSSPLETEDRKALSKYSTRILDFLTTGNVLGEIGVLTDKPRTATGKCETAVQVLELDISDVWDAFKKFDSLEPPLKSRLWRLSALRVSTGIFLDQPAFYGLTKEKLRVRLENGYVEEIENTPTNYTIGPGTGEIVLLHGVAYDGYTNEMYVGPCYIPQNVVYLNFETRQEPCPALFILPSENQQALCKSSLSMVMDTLGNEDINRVVPRLQQLYTSAVNTSQELAGQSLDDSTQKAANLSDKRQSVLSTGSHREPGHEKRWSVLPETTKFMRKSRILKLGMAKRSQSITFSRQVSMATTSALPTVESSPVTSISLTDHLPRINSKSADEILSSAHTAAVAGPSSRTDPVDWRHLSDAPKSASFSQTGRDSEQGFGRSKAATQTLSRTAPTSRKTSFEAFRNRKASPAVSVQQQHKVSRVFTGDNSQDDEPFRQDAAGLKKGVRGKSKMSQLSDDPDRGALRSTAHSSPSGSSHLVRPTTPTAPPKGSDKEADGASMPLNDNTSARTEFTDRCRSPPDSPFTPSAPPSLYSNLDGAGRVASSLCGIEGEPTFPAPTNQQPVNFGSVILASETITSWYTNRTPEPPDQIPHQVPGTEQQRKKRKKTGERKATSKTSTAASIADCNRGAQPSPPWKHSQPLPPPYGLERPARWVASEAPRASEPLARRQEYGAPVTPKDSQARAPRKDSIITATPKESHAPASLKDNEAPAPRKDCEAPAPRKYYETPADRKDYEAYAPRKDCEASAHRKESEVPAHRKDYGAPAHRKDYEASAHRKHYEASALRKDYEAPVPLKDNEAPASWKDSEAPALQKDNEIFAAQTDSESPAPRKDYEAHAPLKDYEAAASGKDYDTPAPGKDYEAPAPQKDNEAPAPRKDHEAPVPRKDNEVPAPRKDCEAHAPVKEYEAPVPRKDYEVPTPVKDYEAPAPLKDYEAPASGKEYEAPAPGKDYEAPVPRKDNEIPAPRKDCEALAPRKDYEAHAPVKENEAPAPGKYYEAPASEKEYKAPAPRKDNNAPAARKDYEAAAPGKGYEAPVPGTEYEAPALGKDYEVRAPRKDYEIPAFGKEYGTSSARKDYEASALRKDYEAPVPRKDNEGPALMKTYDTPEPGKHYEAPAPRRDYDAPAPGKDYEAPALRKDYEAPVPLKDNEAPASWKDSEAPALQKDNEIFAAQTDSESPAPRKDYEAHAPLKDYEAAASGKDYDTPAPGKDYEAPAPQKDNEAPAPRKDHEAPVPRKDNEVPAPRKDCEAHAPVKEYEAPVPRKDYEVPTPVKDYEAPAPLKDYEAPASGKEYEAPAPGKDYEAPVPRKDNEIPAPRKDCEALAPRKDYEAHAPVKENEAPAPGKYYEAPASEKEYKAPAPRKDNNAPAARKDYEAAAPGKGYEAPVPGKEYEAPALGKDYEVRAPRKDYEIPAFGKEYGTSSARKDYEASALRKDYEAPVPRKDNEGPALMKTYDTPEPGKHYEAPAPRRDYDAPAPGKDYEAPAAGKDHEAPAPRKDYEAPVSRKDYELHAPRKDYEAPAPGKGYEAPVLRKDYDTPATGKDCEARAPRKDYEAPAPGKVYEVSAHRKDYEACALRKAYEAPASRKDNEAPAPRKDNEIFAAQTDSESPAPRKDYEAPSPGKDYESHAPGKDYEAPMFRKDYEAHAPWKDYEAPVPRKDYEAHAPGKDYETFAAQTDSEAPAPQKDYEAPALGKDYEARVHGKDYEAPSYRKDYETFAAQADSEAPAPRKDYAAYLSRKDYEEPAPGKDYEAHSPGKDYEAPATWKDCETFAAQTDSGAPAPQNELPAPENRGSNENEPHTPKDAKLNSESEASENDRRSENDAEAVQTVSKTPSSTEKEGDELLDKDEGSAHRESSDGPGKSTETKVSRVKRKRNITIDHSCQTD